MRNYITYEWFTILTVLGLLAIVGAKYVNTLRFGDFLAVVDQKFIDPFDSFLFVNLTISTSIFLFFGYSTFFEILTFDVIPFLKLVFAISAIIIIKTLLERLIGSLFEVDALVDDYLFQKTTFKNYSGLVFLVANLFLLYTKNYEEVIIIAALIIICLINFIGFLTSFKTHQKTINSGLFYFLLYLCALEIAPYVLLYKVISEYNA